MAETEVNAPISSEEYKKVTEDLYKQNLEVVRLYKEVERLNEDLKVANEGQANLLHIINHQIKGYMTKARLVFDDLTQDESYNLPEVVKPLIKEGYDAVSEGVMFVQNFLNASNIEQGTYIYNMTTFDFRPVVEKIAKNQEQNATERDLTFEFTVEDGNYQMKGDQIQLEQVVINLVDNSIKYTPTGGLKVHLGKQDGRILFSVADTGVGLSDEVKKVLFTKGGRDKNSSKINVNSTGFGLAFVKGVVEAHNGRVWAESEGPGKGSTFFLELPAAN